MEMFAHKYLDVLRTKSQGLMTPYIIKNYIQNLKHITWGENHKWILVTL